MDVLCLFVAIDRVTCWLSTSFPPEPTSVPDELFDLWPFMSAEQFSLIVDLTEGEQFDEIVSFIDTLSAQDDVLQQSVEKANDKEDQLAAIVGASKALHKTTERGRYP